MTQTSDHSDNSWISLSIIKRENSQPHVEEEKNHERSRKQTVTLGTRNSQVEDRLLSKWLIIKGMFTGHRKEGLCYFKQFSIGLLIWKANVYEQEDANTDIRGIQQVSAVW